MFLIILLLFVIAYILVIINDNEWLQFLVEVNHVRPEVVSRARNLPEGKRKFLARETRPEEVRHR